MKMKDFVLAQIQPPNITFLADRTRKLHCRAQVPNYNLHKRATRTKAAPWLFGMGRDHKEAVLERERESLPMAEGIIGLELHKVQHRRP